MKRVLTGLAALFAVALLTVMAASSAFAVKAPHVKVDVCHATASQTNPYVLINVNVNSVGVANDLNGHAGHAGDIWAPFVFDGVTYPGQGDQSILANGCKLPTAEGSGTIEVQKVVVGDAGSDQFEFFVDGVSVGTGADGFDAVKTFLNIEGDHGHTVSETVLAGDKHTYSTTVVCTSDTEGVVASADGTSTATGDVSLRAGEHVVCVFTNTPNETPPNGGGTLPPVKLPHPPKCTPRLAMQGKCQLKDTGVTDQQVIEDSGSRVQGG